MQTGQRVIGHAKSTLYNCIVKNILSNDIVANKL